MLKRLQDLQTEFFASISNGKQTPLTRPFQQFSPALKTIPEMSNGHLDPIAKEILAIATAQAQVQRNGTDSEMRDATSTPKNRPNTIPELRVSDDITNSPLAVPNPTPQTPKTPTNSSLQTPTGTPKSTRKNRLLASGQKHFLEPSVQNKAKRRKLETSMMDIDECSTSSSWAELEPNIIGQWQVFPVNLVTRQIFTLRYLAPLGEYQEVCIT